MIVPPFFWFSSRAGAASRRSCAGCSLFVLGSVVLGPSDVRANTTLDGVLYVCDSTDDRVLAFQDLDDSGFIEAEEEGEMRIFYDDSSPGPDLSTPSHLVADGDGRVYLLDGGTLDAVLVLADNNHDGDANDEGEVRIFYSSDTGEVSLGTPNTLVAGPDGAFYIADDGKAARRIVRLEDLNGDGDAQDEGEATVVYDTSALSPVLPEDVESLAFAARGHLYVGDTTLGTVFELVDANDDGDFLDDAEVRVFYQSTEEQPLQDIDCLAVVDGSVFVCDEDSGLILRLRDTNKDGKIQGMEEASVFVDRSSAVKLNDTNDFTVLADGRFLVVDGKLDTVFVVQDLNDDGDALDVDEVSRWILDGGESLATPSGLVFVPREDGEITTYIRGDVSGDGKLDNSDPLALLGILFLGQPSAICSDVLDSDDNGTVNIADAVMLLNFLFAGGSPPPAPFPESGPDPTADSLECESDMLA